MTGFLSRRSLVQSAAASSLAAALGGAAQARAQEATPVATPAAAASTSSPATGDTSIGSSGPITIFQAKKIITLDPVTPEATHVAVRNGRILGAGNLGDLTGWGEYTIDTTFADLVIIPGLIEAHNHIFEGFNAFYPYVGYFDRPAVDGGVLPGITSFDALISFLKEEDAKLTDPNQPLLGIEFDPIYFRGNGQVFSKETLDQVSTTRQVAVWYASEHTLMLNSAALKANNITSAVTDPGALKGEDGEPTGELNSPSAMGLAPSIFDLIVKSASDPATIKALGQFATNCGCTTVADMASTVLAIPETLPPWTETVNAPDYPARIMAYPEPTLPGSQLTPGNIVEAFQNLQASTTDKLHFRGIKLVMDGSIQDFTAYMNWPGYYQAPNDYPSLLMTEAEVVEWVTPLQAAGIQVSGHCNGDGTVQIFLNAIETAARAHASPNIRHVVQHSQLTTPAQYERMANLGVCANIFANHLWYYGDQHYEITVGPSRAVGMEAAATATAKGVPFSLHTDAGVTPLGCIHSMWCAVNRVTPKGRVLGEAEKITTEQALHAVTLGSAYLLGLDAELGSIQPGKWADFTVLDHSPMDVDPTDLLDLVVWGTVLAGQKFPGAGAAKLGS
ncbi:MAG: amidohydrolase [Thermomicrobiales bacterium]